MNVVLAPFFGSIDPFLKVNIVYINVMTHSFFLFFDGNSLENWYYRILVLLTGNLKNAEIAVDALSIW